jgi:membrane-associated phospholipid phosphatase
MLNALFYYEACLIKKIQTIFGTSKDWKNTIKIIKLFTNQRMLMWLSFISLLFWDTRLLLSMLISKYLNLEIKLFFKVDRPNGTYSWLNNVKKRNSYSFPSNSIQNCIIFYSFMLSYLSSIYPLFTVYLNIIYYSLISSIALTRTISAKHYPHDIICSILLSNSIMYIVDV